MPRSKNIYFYLPLLIIFVTIYRNSLLPASIHLIGNEIFLIFFLSFIYLIYIFDFQSLFNFKFKTLFYSNNKYYLILLILLSISTLLYNVQELTNPVYLVRFLDLFFYFIIFFFIVPKFIILNPFYFKKLVLIISYFSFATAIIGFFMLLGLVFENPGYTGLMISFIGHPNYVPVIFNAGIISTIFYFDWQKEHFNFFIKLFYIISITIQLFATLLTFTRAGYIGLGAGLLLYFLLKYKNKFLIFVPLYLLGILFIIPPFFKAKGYASFISRFHLLIPAYSMITQNTTSLLWGYGITNTFKVFLQYNTFNLSGEDYLNNPHNALASLIMMFGIIFTIVILSFLSYILIKFFVKSLKSKEENIKILNAYLISFLTSYVFLSFFDSGILMPEFFNAQIFLVFLGILDSLAKNYDPVPLMLNY